MSMIVCARCDGTNPFLVRPDRLFACLGCDIVLDPRDIDQDGHRAPSSAA
ncbi:hypothetical protein ABZZ17_20450 [Streptomyces sp. NPDC006512]